MSEKPPGGGKIITRQSDGAGYLFNDNRAAHEGVDEADILCCPHCQRTINLQQWRKAREQGGGGYCSRCQAPICGPCATIMMTQGCVPYVKKIEEALERNYRIQQNRKILGI